MALVFLDLDGTLLHQGDPAPGAIEAVKALKANGHIVAIATGRSPRLLYDKDKLFDTDYLVLANGGFVSHGKKVIYEKYIPNTTVKRLMDFVDDIKADLVVEYFDRYVAYRKDTEIPDQFSDIFNIERPALDPVYYPDEKVFCMVVFKTDDAIKMQSAFPELQFNLSNAIGYDVNIKGDLKADGVRALIDYLDYNEEEVYAVGDGHNDITMIKAVRHGIAMGNGNDALKQVAEYVTTDVNDYGVYNAMKHYGLIK